MLLKLFKYDMKRVMKTCLVMVVVIVGITVIGCAAGVLYSMSERLTINSNVEFAEEFDQEVAEETGDLPAYNFYAPILMVISLVAVEMAMTAPVVITVVFLFIMFFSHFRGAILSDRGYLTLTLPVTGRQILLSKLFSSVIGTAILALTAAGSMTLISLSATVMSYSSEYGSMYTGLFSLYFGIFEGIAHGLFVPDIIISAILLPLLIIVLLFYVYISYYFFMILGYTVAKRKKIGAGIGFFIGGSYLVVILSYLIGIGVFIGEGIIGSAINANVENYSFVPIASVLFGALLLFFTVLSVVMWIVENKLLEKKVDLL